MSGLRGLRVSETHYFYLAKSVVGIVSRLCADGLTFASQTNPNVRPLLRL